MSLRLLLADLIGAEVQSRPITIGGASKNLHFRQFDDATGRALFEARADETPEERGQRVMVGVVAASICDEEGALISTPEEVSALPGIALTALYAAAAATNNIAPPAMSALADDVAAAGAENAGPKP